jgi:oxalate decarboxylase/phosphoglucose isomerase-like protein (cupin superfamily)
MGAVDEKAYPTETFDWGIIKWTVTPGDTPDASLTFGEVVLLPGKGHERHNHPEAEEILYVLSGTGEQTVESQDGGQPFTVRAGDTIHIPVGVFHSTTNTGWAPLRLLALYSPGGAEGALRGLPDYRQVPPGQPPELTRSS